MLLERLKLTPEERREKQKVALHDSLALSSLVGVAVALSLSTYLLFHSFSMHREMLEQRWEARGNAALAAGKPIAAIDSLHSALAYAPDDRGVQIELAKALAAAGKTQEAQAYFNTLLETEPGSGIINLQLARLAVRQNNVQGAVDKYEAAIDGTWNGDAFARRRNIRMELARYLIAQKRMAEARNLLLITSGNGPDNYALQVAIGNLLEEAQDPTDAVDVYRKAARHKATRLQALEGVGHAALALGHFEEARTALDEAMEEPGFAHEPDAVKNGVHAGLDAANGVLAVYPAMTLRPAERARRIAQGAELAEARLVACPAAGAAGNAAAVAAGSGAQSGPAAGQTAPLPASQAAPLTGVKPAPLAALAAHLRQLNPLAAKPVPAVAATPAPDTQATLDTLAARWAQMPTGVALRRQLLADPGFAQDTLQLVLATEQATAGACGQPTGEDAAWLRIARMENGAANGAANGPELQP